MGRGNISRILFFLRYKIHDNSTMTSSKDHSRDDRINSKHILFNTREMNKTMVSKISTGCMLEGFIGIMNCVGGDMLCSAKRGGNQKFNFKNGYKSMSASDARR